MDILLLAIRLVLGGVFIVAAVSKIADRGGSRQAMMDFGIPASLAPVAATLLPVFELLVAAALLFGPVARLGAAGAVVLLVVFMIAIGVNLAQGRRPDCHCFGQVHSSPVGGSTLVRNALLAALAGVVLLAGPGASPLTALAILGGSGASTILLVGLLVLAGVMAVQWWFMMNLLQQNGRILTRLDAFEEIFVKSGLAQALAGGLKVGSNAPTFALPSQEGGTLTLESLRELGKPIMLLFTDPDCGPCTSLLPEVVAWDREHADKITIALLSRKGASRHDGRDLERQLTYVGFQEKREVADAYQVGGTPTAVMVRPDGSIASKLAAGPEAIRNLMDEAVNGKLPVPMLNGGGGHGHQHGHPAPALQMGDPVPDVKLPDLAGNQVDLADFRGTDTVVLFWNPGCGYCQQMLPDLKAWEAQRSPQSPRLLVVSAGSIEDNRAQGLNSPVVIDQQFALGYRLGANGTPSAVRLDTEGRVASEIAVGADDVLALCRAVAPA